LHKYFDSSPCHFFQEQVFDQYYSWLVARDAADRASLLRYFSDHTSDINRSLTHLEEINSIGCHEEPLSTHDVERMRFVDQNVNPLYLRLTEGVMAPLLHPVAYFGRLDRKKGTAGLDVWNIVQEVKQSAIADAVASYENVIRNGVAHGGITFEEREVEYQDKRGNVKTITHAAVVRLMDDLLDACNALALGLGVFLLTRQGMGFRLPQFMLYQELRARTKAPYWEVDTCIPTTTIKGNQIIVYARANTRDSNKVQLSAFQSGVLAGVLASGYDRYFVSIRSEQALSGWAAFSGAKIAELIELGDFTIEDCKGVVEDDLIYYDPRSKFPAFLSYLNTFVISARIRASVAMAEFRRKLDLPSIDVRNISIHRNGWRTVLRGEIVIHFAGGSSNAQSIRKSLRRIVREAARRARQGEPFFSVARYLPLGFVRLSVFRKSFRKRRLSSFGLGADLICTIQIKRIGRIRVPDISGASIETRGKFRIAWNKAWLEETK